MAPPSDPRRPRALLTGRHGFTGRYVERELERAGYEVFGLTRMSDGTEVDVDLLDREGVNAAVRQIGPDVILHLAAIAFVAHGDVDAIYRVNVVGTRNLLDALVASECQPELVVLASSANIYGNADVEPITEDTPPAPANDYAVSKLSMEYMARLWMDRLPIVITRPFNYTGAGQSEKFLVPKIVGHFKRKERVIELGNTDVFRDFSDVRDVANIYCSLLESRPVGEIINICSGVGHSLGEILAMMEEIAGYQIEKKVNPAFVRANEVRKLTGSNEKLRDYINFQGRHGLEETLMWMYGA